MVKKREATYSHEDEGKARGWLEAVSGEPIEGFFETLKDGSYLCRVLNRLQPGLVPAKYERPQSFPIRQIETVGQYLDGCRKYGMEEKDLFVSVDLVEEQNKNMVLASIISLGRLAQKHGYEGPKLGPKEAEANPREFTEDQLKQGRGEIGLQMGSNKGATQAGMSPYGKTRQIYQS